MILNLMGVNNMKLAEALQERADLNRKIAQLRNRLEMNATVQEGEKTAEDPEELMKELDGCIERLEELIVRINLTNCETKANGKSLTELIARRDCLTLKIGAYRSLLDQASSITQRMSMNEIKILRAVDVKAIQKQTDELSKELRQIDSAIQQANWQTELN